MLLLQALELERSPTREEIEHELARVKGAGKRKVGSMDISDMSASASKQQERSPSSQVSKISTERDLHARIGGLEENMKLILQHLRIGEVKATEANTAKEDMTNADNSVGAVDPVHNEEMTEKTPDIVSTPAQVSRYSRSK
jgi:hypothetical protein